MSKKEKFIKEIEEIIESEVYAFSQESLEYLESLKTSKSKEGLTDNGKKILKYMQDNFEVYNNVFQAKSIGEGISLSGRSVSGSMRKLVSEGFVNKLGNNPVSYEITSLGKDYQVD